MSIAVIMASPRKKDSYKICREIESLVKKSDLDYIYLSEMNIEDCRGCDLCFKKSENLCPSNDDVKLIRDKLLSSQAIIIASPVYAYQVTASMKRLIDRLSYLFHRQELVGKGVLLVVTSEGGGHNQVIKYLSMTANGWALNVVGKLTIISPMFFKAERLNSTWGYNEKYARKKHNEIAKASSNLEEYIYSNDLKTPTYSDIFMFNCLRSKTYTSQADYDYWKNKGWLKSYYYYETKLSFLKKIFGKCMCMIVDLASRKIENRIT